MNYGLSVIEFVVLVMQMIDTVHEGDSDRLVVIVKYLLLMFKAKSNYSKYAIEPMRFITQVKCTLTAQMAARVLNDRFVNLSGKSGHNMETDIAMGTPSKQQRFLSMAWVPIKPRRQCRGRQAQWEEYNAYANHMTRTLMSHLIELHTPEKQLKLMNSAWSKTSATCSPSELYLADVMPLSAT